MEEEKKNSGQTLGIAALITAIITFVMAFIHCVVLIEPLGGGRRNARRIHRHLGDTDGMSFGASWNRA